MGRVFSSKLKDDHILTVFNSFDENGDGTLSKDEFKDACKLMELDFSDKEIYDMFEKMDTSHDEKIQPDEFKEFVKKQYKSNDRLFIAKFDIMKVVLMISAQLKKLLRNKEWKKFDETCLKFQVNSKGDKEEEPVVQQLEMLNEDDVM